MSCVKSEESRFILEFMGGEFTLKASGDAWGRKRHGVKGNRDFPRPATLSPLGARADAHVATLVDHAASRAGHLSTAQVGSAASSPASVPCTTQSLSSAPLSARTRWTRPARTSPASPLSRRPPRGRRLARVAWIRRPAAVLAHQRKVRIRMRADVWGVSPHPVTPSTLGARND